MRKSRYKPASWHRYGTRQESGACALHLRRVATLTVALPTEPVNDQSQPEFTQLAIICAHGSDSKHSQRTVLRWKEQGE